MSIRFLHIVPGTDDESNGMSVVARLLAEEQGDAEVVDLKNSGHRLSTAECQNLLEVWVHGMWLPREWLACWRALRAGRKLVRVPHGSLSPLYLKCQSPLKKRLVGQIERFFLRRCDRIIATCEAEKGWIELYLGRRCPPIEVTDIKRFFNLSHKEQEKQEKREELHLLYLGRRHPLKGVEYLERAVEELSSPNAQTPIVLKIVSNAFGEEKEKIWNWCDVLVLPTLSENFGLVIAEALERGKRVITTDGAPAWEEECKIESGKLKVEGGKILSGYDGRLIYLKGFRDGTNDERVRLLQNAIADIMQRKGL